MGRWQGKVVWITGGGTGMGKFMALRFASEGATVAISGRRAERLDRVVNEVHNAGGQALALVCDVTDENAIASSLAQIADTFGHIDVVVANAGVSVSGPMEHMTMDDWRRQFDVNVCGAAMTAAKATPYLRQTQGRLALVGSVAALAHFANAAPYQASKAAVMALGSSLSVELAPDGITCTTIHPGFVHSDIFKVDNKGGLHETRIDKRPQWLMWQTDRAAQVMCNAIYRRKREFVFTGHGRLGWFLARHFPGFLYQIAKRIPNDTAQG